MKVSVDKELCQGHSVCLNECPEVFDVVEQGGEYPFVNLLIAEPDETLREKVLAAAKFCPNRVITVEG